MWEIPENPDFYGACYGACYEKIPGRKLCRNGTSSTRPWGQLNLSLGQSMVGLLIQSHFLQNSRLEFSKKREPQLNSSMWKASAEGSHFEDIFCRRGSVKNSAMFQSAEVENNEVPVIFLRCWRLNTKKAGFLFSDQVVDWMSAWMVDWWNGWTTSQWVNGWVNELGNAWTEE